LNEDTQPFIFLVQKKTDEIIRANELHIRALKLRNKQIDAEIALNNKRGYVVKTKTETKIDVETTRTSLKRLESSENAAYKVLYMYELAAIDQGEELYSEGCATTAAALQEIKMHKENLTNIEKKQRYTPSIIEMVHIARHEYEKYAHRYKISMEKKDYNGARKHLGQSLLWIRLISKLSDGKSADASPEALNRVYKEWDERFLDK
jgi:hypothetical protein